MWQRLARWAAGEGLLDEHLHLLRRLRRDHPQLPLAGLGEPGQGGLEGGRVDGQAVAVAGMEVGQG